MVSILEPKVTVMQELIVPVAPATMEPMVTSDEIRDFSERLNSALDAKNDERVGRQARLGKAFGLSQKAARKWLVGESFPEVARMIQLAKMLDVRFEWLATGRGPRYLNEELGSIKPDESVDRPLEKIRQVIDGQHRASRISDEDATLLRAAVESVQTNMAPTIRAAVLLMLGSQTPAENQKENANQVIEGHVISSHSSSREVKGSAKDFAGSKIADIRSEAVPDGEKHHDQRKKGT
jgi:hypothetical protein